MEQLKQKLTPFRQIGTPLGSSEEVEIMLKSSGLYTTEYYPFPSLEARTPFHLQRKLLDLKRMKYILVEKRKMVVKPFNLARYSRLRSDYISQVLLFPVPFQVKNIPLFPEEEIVRYINSHFEKVATFGHMVLLRNRHSTPISSFS